MDFGLDFDCINLNFGNKFEQTTVCSCSPHLKMRNLNQGYSRWKSSVSSSSLIALFPDVVVVPGLLEPALTGGGGGDGVQDTQVNSISQPPDKTLCRVPCKSSMVRARIHNLQTHISWWSPPLPLICEPVKDKAQKGSSGDCSHRPRRVRWSDSDPVRILTALMAPLSLRAADDSLFFL